MEQVKAPLLSRRRHNKALKQTTTPSEQIFLAVYANGRQEGLQSAQVAFSAHTAALLIDCDMRMESTPAAATRWLAQK